MRLPGGAAFATREEHSLLRERGAEACGHGHKGVEHGAEAGEHRRYPVAVEDLRHAAACGALDAVQHLGQLAVAEDAFRQCPGFFGQLTQTHGIGAGNHAEAILGRDGFPEHLAIHHAEVDESKELGHGLLNLHPVSQSLLTQHTNALEFAVEDFATFALPGFVEFVGQLQTLVRCQAAKAFVQHEALVNGALAFPLGAGQFHENICPRHAGGHLLAEGIEQPHQHGGVFGCDAALRLIQIGGQIRTRLLPCFTGNLTHLCRSTFGTAFKPFADDGIRAVNEQTFGGEDGGVGDQFGIDDGALAQAAAGFLTEPALPDAAHAVAECAGLHLLDLGASAEGVGGALQNQACRLLRHVHGHRGRQSARLHGGHGLLHGQAAQPGLCLLPDVGVGADLIQTLWRVGAGEAAAGLGQVRRAVLTQW